MPETKSEQIHRDLQEKREHKNKSRKRRISRIIMAFDAVVILIILIILGTRNPAPQYSSTMVNISGTEIRFSLGESKESDDYLFTITFREASGNSFKKVLKGKLGQLALLDNEKKILHMEIGSGMKDLLLAPNEVRTFSMNMSKSKLNSYLRTMKIVKKKKKSIIDLSNQYYNFKARVTIEFPDPLTIPLEVKHEVKL